MKTDAIVFDALRDILAGKVKLDLVNRVKMEGHDKVSTYFSRYAEAAQWQFSLGAVEGRPALLAFESKGSMEKPTHFVLLDWREEKVSAIRDFLFAAYVMETRDWVRVC